MPTYSKKELLKQLNKNGCLRLELSKYAGKQVLFKYMTVQMGTDAIFFRTASQLHSNHQATACIERKVKKKSQFSDLNAVKFGKPVSQSYHNSRGNSQPVLLCLLEV